MTTDAQAITPSERIEARTFLIRGHKVMLDSDLAELYGVETKALTRAVRRKMNDLISATKTRKFPTAADPDHLQDLYGQALAFYTQKSQQGCSPN